MSVEEILLDAEERMEKALAKLKQDLTGIRTGRASPGMVDSLRVEAYGSPVPIKQIASVSAPEPQQLVIRPFDPGTVKDIEKGIIASDLGLAPQSDGKVIRLNIPPLSGEVRRKMVARTKELAEETKVAIRNIRRDANKQADQEQKDKQLSEDDADAAKDDVQKLVKKFEEKCNGLAKAKEAEVMND
jgi:ribosome recycling factor